MNDGRIVSSDGIDVAPADWPDAFEEHQVPWSNALQARARDGVPYLLGPTARVTLAHDQLHPLAREALAATGLGTELRTSVFRSIVARAVELLHALATRREVQARDVFDLDHLRPHAAAAKTAPLDEVKQALEQLTLIDFAMFNTQVVPFLPSDLAAYYGTNEAWLELSEKVCLDLSAALPPVSP